MLARTVRLTTTLLAMASLVGPVLAQGTQQQGTQPAATAPATSAPAATAPAATAPAGQQATRTPQQQRMVDCNAGAAKRSLSGDPRKQFMSDCLSGKVPPEPPAAAPAAAAPAANSQQDKMRACNAQAGEQKLTGDARKTFMSKCLSG